MVVLFQYEAYFIRINSFGFHHASELDLMALLHLVAPNNIKNIYIFMDVNVNVVARINVRIQFGGEPNNGFSLNTRCQMFVSKYENQYMCTL